MRTKYSLVVFVNDGWILAAEGADVLVHATRVWISFLRVTVPSIKMRIGQEKVPDDVEEREIG